MRVSPISSSSANVFKPKPNYIGAMAIRPYRPRPQRVSVHMMQQIARRIVRPPSTSTTTARPGHTLTESTDKGFFQSRDGGKTMYCKKCDRTFVHLGHWKLHLLGHSNPLSSESNAHGSLTSDISSSSKSSSKGQGHRRTSKKKNPTKTKNERKFPCHLCHKSFSREHHFKVHLRTHTGERPFQCKQCDKAFAQAGTLKAHVRTHSGERPFECVYCNKSFSVSSNWSRHMRTHRDARPFKCNQCSKMFTESGALKVHLRIHSGERPFQCTVCKKTFSRTDTLKKHIKMHTIEASEDATVSSSRVASSSMSARPLRSAPDVKPCA